MECCPSLQGLDPRILGPGIEYVGAQPSPELRGSSRLHPEPSPALPLPGVLEEALDKIDLEKGD